MPFSLIDELGDIDTRRQCPDLHFGILCLERALSHGFPVEGEQGEYDFPDRLGKSDVEEMAADRNPHLFGGQGRSDTYVGCFQFIRIEPFA